MKKISCLYNMYKYCFIVIIQVKYCVKLYDPKCRKNNFVDTKTVLRCYYTPYR